MNVVFRSPDLDGNCVFASYVCVRIETPSGERLVFRTPVHANGGCIFSDPSELLERRRGGTSHRLFEEDEEILAVIVAATLRRGYGGFLGVRQ
jgi:hypothetical protein